MDNVKHKNRPGSPLRDLVPLGTAKVLSMLHTLGNFLDNSEIGALMY